MEQRSRLLEQLKEYGKSDFYPFHMPGHKRNLDMGQVYENPFSIDITEIHGFDNFHNPEGILKQSMEWASDIYGSDKTYYLVNGSSCGILAAIFAVTSCGGKVLMGRNCHKAAFHAAFLNHLRLSYVYPQVIDELGIQGGILASDVEKILNQESDIQAVVIVSPTYEGIVSDIREIADIVHRKNIPLIVDEAHGAHFTFGEDFPSSALELGADIVIQSVHKTLPCFTQTAILHMKYGYVREEELERYLRIFQSSSPSYIFMAGIENCIHYMNSDGRVKMRQFALDLKSMREKLSFMDNLKIAGTELVGKYGVKNIDLSKFVVITKDISMNGLKLDNILREQYHLEMEMVTADNVVAITSVADTKEALDRFTNALLEIDEELCQIYATGIKHSQIKARLALDHSLHMDKDYRHFVEKEQISDLDRESDKNYTYFFKEKGRDMKIPPRPEVKMTIFEGITSPKEFIPIENSVGNISGEFVYVYPPGIPIVAPGEMILPSLLHTILSYQDMGLPVQGLRDKSGKTIQIIRK
ncbi:PLP-dependent transferase [Lachnospiraceae bacterium 62-35]